MVSLNHHLLRTGIRTYGKFIVEVDSNLGFLDYKFFVKETGEEIKF